MPEEKTAVEQKVDELMEGKPVAAPEEKKIEVREKSMIEEANELKDVLTKLRDEIRIEREKIDKVNAQAILGGKSLGGNNIEKTKEEIAAAEAKEILSPYYGE